MIVLVFKSGDTLRLGVRTAQGVIDVAAVKAARGGSVPDTPEAFYRAGLDGLQALKEFVGGPIQPRHIYAEDSLTLGPVTPNPGKIVCIGLNYRKHAEESGAAIPEHPVVFSKFNNTLAAAGQAIPLTRELTRVDYEAELAVVIGRTARHVDESRALDCVLGYCNANDLSDRSLQFLSSQWLLGKTPDYFFPIGPYLVTADEIGDPQSMPIKGWLNGQLRQNSSTADMIFNVAQVIAFISRYMTLDPGDVISTGTPEGVILGMQEKVWMKPGDEYTVEIGSLGRLSNRMVEG